MSEKAVKYSVVLERNDDGSYTVTVPALSGCVTQGDNIAASLAHAKEAIETHVEGLLILGKAVPEDVADVTLALRETQETFIFKVEAVPDKEELELQSLKESGTLYAEVYDEEPDLRKLTEIAIANWPE